MANLTLVIDDEVLRRARIRALERGTSVDALIRGYLTDLAGRDTAREALNNLISLAERSTASSGRAGRTWTREDAHER